jgi:hypothetical protein
MIEPVYVQESWNEKNHHLQILGHRMTHFNRAQLPILVHTHRYLTMLITTQIHKGVVVICIPIRS